MSTTKTKQPSKNKKPAAQQNGNGTTNHLSINTAAVAAPLAAPRFEHLSPEQISPFRYQPRRTFDQAELQELADDMKTPDPATGQMRGVLQSIVVRPDPDWIVEPGRLNGKDGFLLVNTRYLVIDPRGREYNRYTLGFPSPFFNTREEAEAMQGQMYELVAGERRWRSAA